MDAADYRATIMRRNQMERYGVNVQHWLPNIIANDSGTPFPDHRPQLRGRRSLGAQVRHFRARNVRFQAGTCAPSRAAPFFGPQWTIDHIAAGDVRAAGEETATSEKAPARG